MKEFMQLDRNLKLRTLTVFLAALLNSSIYPNMTIYYAKYFGAVVTGILLMVISVLSFVAGLYGGHLADSHGRKPIMLAGGILLTLGYTIAAAMNNPWLHEPRVTFIAFLVASVGGSLADPAEQAMMIDSSTPRNRKYVYALIYWIINISVMLGAAIGGWFFRDYLLELLLVLIGISIFNLCIVRFGMTETLLVPKTQSDSVWSALKSYMAVLSDRRYMVFLLGLVLLSVITRQPDYYLAVHLGNAFHSTHIFGIYVYGQRMLSIITLINTVMIVTMMSAFTRLSERWTLRQAYAIGTAFFVVGFAGSFVQQSFWPLAVSAIILTIGEMLTVPANQTMRADMMNPKKIGAYSGANTAVSPIAAVIAGALVSVSGLLGDVGMAGIMVICGVASVLLVNHSAKLPASF